MNEFTIVFRIQFNKPVCQHSPAVGFLFYWCSQKYHPDLFLSTDALWVPISPLTFKQSGGHWKQGWTSSSENDFRREVPFEDHSTKEQQIQYSTSSFISHKIHFHIQKSHANLNKGQKKTWFLLIPPSFLSYFRISYLNTYVTMYSESPTKIMIWL